MRYEGNIENKVKDIENVDCDSLKINVWKNPVGVAPWTWIDGIIDVYCRSFGFLDRGRQMIAQAVYQEAGVMDVDTHRGLRLVSFTKIYQRLKHDCDTESAQVAGGFTREEYERVLKRMDCLSNGYSVESQLFGNEDGMCVDELIKADYEANGIKIEVSTTASQAMRANRILNSFHKEMKNYFIKEDVYDFICSCIIFGCICSRC